MSNAFMSGLQAATNFKLTENGGVAHCSTGTDLYDMFALGGAYRTRSDEDCILLFKNAYEENPIYALKCLFYLRDIRFGQGERRFFRVCMKWLATVNKEAALRNLEYVSGFGRWDDLFIFIGTPLEDAMFNHLKEQLALDVQSKTPSLLAKWLKSENTSSAESRAIAVRTRKAFGMTAKQYRKTLSILRGRIRVLEKLMSANRWDEIEFDKIPSKAGLVYRNAFARRDMIKAKYEAFAKNETTKVNAKSLFPYEVVSQAYRCREGIDGTNRAMINKYWDALNSYIADVKLDALAVVDTSASMRGSGSMAPIDVAISLGMVCAARAVGPFAGHYISFSSRPQLIRVQGVDFVDSVNRIYQTNLCENTNLEATFDLLLNTIVANKCNQSELPGSIIIISDQEIDTARGGGYWGRSSITPVNTMMENMRIKWANHGYTLPKLIYWNVDARHNTILDEGPGVTYVSGASPAIFQQIVTGKTGIDLMYDKLNSERYSCIH